MYYYRVTTWQYIKFFKIAPVLPAATLKWYQHECINNYNPVIYIILKWAILNNRVVLLLVLSVYFDANIYILPVYYLCYSVFSVCIYVCVYVRIPLQYIYLCAYLCTFCSCLYITVYITVIHLSVLYLSSIYIYILHFIHMTYAYDK